MISNRQLKIHWSNATENGSVRRLDEAEFSSAHFVRRLLHTVPEAGRTNTKVLR